MNNKKAILIMSEALKLVIAVLCIGALIYLSVSIYQLFSYKTGLAQAKSGLDEIFVKIELVDKESKPLEYLMTSPKNWIITRYGNQICICPEEKSKQNEICQTKGFCKESELKIIIGDNVISCAEQEQQINQIPNYTPIIKLERAAKTINIEKIKETICLTDQTK